MTFTSIAPNQQAPVEPAICRGCGLRSPARGIHAQRRVQFHVATHAHEKHHRTKH